MATVREEALATAVATAKAKLAESLEVLEQPLTDAFENRETLRRTIRRGVDQDELKFAAADAAWWKLEKFAAAIRSANAVAP